jgi:hypothetical protein
VLSLLYTRICTNLWLYCILCCTYWMLYIVLCTSIWWCIVWNVFYEKLGDLCSGFIIIKLLLNHIRSIYFHKIKWTYWHLSLVRCNISRRVDSIVFFYSLLFLSFSLPLYPSIYRPCSFSLFEWCILFWFRFSLIGLFGHLVFANEFPTLILFYRFYARLWDKFYSNKIKLKINRNDMQN